MALYIRNGDMKKCIGVSKKADSDSMYYRGKGIQIGEAAAIDTGADGDTDGGTDR